jgi:hypothetical protein
MKMIYTHKDIKRIRLIKSIARRLKTQRKIELRQKIVDALFEIELKHTYESF